MKGLKAGVRSSKTVERCNGRAAGNEVTGRRADGKRPTIWVVQGRIRN